MWGSPGFSPPSVDWSTTPDHQAQTVIDAIRSASYSKDRPAPDWPLEPGHQLQNPSVQRAVVGTFENRSHVWRREGSPKVLHTRGAVGLFRLEVVAGGAGGVLEPGESNLFIARYSRARGPRSSEPHVASVAAKFFRYRRPCVDIPFLSWRIGLGQFRRMWLEDFSTDFPDPRTMAGLSTSQLGQVEERVASLRQVARTIDAPDSVTAYSLPLAPSLNGARLIWRHSNVARNILLECKDEPFVGSQLSPDEGVPVSQLAYGAVWAELFWQASFTPGDKADRSGAKKIANIYVETGLFHSPLGDSWLQFTHPWQVRT